MFFHVPALARTHMGRSRSYHSSSSIFPFSQNPIASLFGNPRYKFAPKEATLRPGMAGERKGELTMQGSDRSVGERKEGGKKTLSSLWVSSWLAKGQGGGERGEKTSCSSTCPRIAFSPLPSFVCSFADSSQAFLFFPFPPLLMFVQATPFPFLLPFSLLRNRSASPLRPLPFLT